MKDIMKDILEDQRLAVGQKLFTHTLQSWFNLNNIVYLFFSYVIDVMVRVSIRKTTVLEQELELLGGIGSFRHLDLRKD